LELYAPRVYAAERNMSVSRLVEDMLRERMQEAREYDESMRRFLAKKPVGRVITTWTRSLEPGPPKTFASSRKQSSR
jgi:hypothetical protein